MVPSEPLRVLIIFVMHERAELNNSMHFYAKLGCVAAPMIITFYVLGNLLIIYLGSVSVAATRLVPVITGCMWVDFCFNMH